MVSATFVRPATTINDTPIGDLFLADANFGENTNLAIGKFAYNGVDLNTIRVLLRFDLSSLPAGAFVTAAVLTLTALADLIDAGVFLCSRLTQTAWTEDGATWNTYDGENPWAAPGGDYSDTLHDSCTLHGPTDNLVFGGLAALVADAVANRGGQLHLLLRSASESTTSDVSFVWSSEADQDDPPQSASVFPKLVVTYTVPGAAGGGFSAGMQEFSAGMGG